MTGKAAELEKYHSKGNCCAVAHNLTHSRNYLLLSAEKLITPVLVIYFYLLTSVQGLFVAMWVENNLCLCMIFYTINLKTRCKAKQFFFQCW